MIWRTYRSNSSIAHVKGCYPMPEESQESTALTPEPNQQEQKSPRKPLPANTRWLTFAAVIAVCVIVGIAVPLAQALTDDHSVMNPDHKALSNSTAEDSSASAASSAATENTASSAASSSSSAAASVGTTQDDYLLPDVATKAYTKSDLSSKSDYDLYLARNEVFAKYGRKFKNDDLNQYFSTKSWYVPTYDPATFDSMPTPLNDLEQANVNLIRQIEAERHSPYAA